MEPTHAESVNIKRKIIILGTTSIVLLFLFTFLKYSYLNSGKNLNDYSEATTCSVPFWKASKFNVLANNALNISLTNVFLTIPIIFLIIAISRFFLGIKAYHLLLFLIIYLNCLPNLFIYNLIFSGVSQLLLLLLVWRIIFTIRNSNNFPLRLKSIAMRFFFPFYILSIGLCFLALTQSPLPIVESFSSIMIVLLMAPFLMSLFFCSIVQVTHGLSIKENTYWENNLGFNWKQVEAKDISVIQQDEHKVIILYKGFEYYSTKRVGLNILT